MTNSDQENDRRPWLPIAVVVLVTAVAIWLVPDETPEPEPLPELPPAGAPPSAETPPVETDRPPAPSPPRDEATAPTAGTAGARSPEPVTAAPPEAEGAAARAWLADHPDAGADEIRVQADRFMEAGRVADAWLLYFKAARDGDGRAAMALAEQADPDHFRADASVHSAPDLILARKWYLRAQALGVAAAEERLGRLRERLAERAASGDEAAAVLLQEWRSR